MIVVNNERAIRAIKRLGDRLNNTALAVAALGETMREYIEQTIEMGGRKRPYLPLSEWTQYRTGRVKPLITLADRFHVQSNRRTAIVYFVPPTGKKFDIWRHHRGYTTPAVTGKLMVVGERFFKSKKKGKAPAREIFPTQAEASVVIARQVRAWINEGIRDTWH